MNSVTQGRRGGGGGEGQSRVGRNFGTTGAVGRRAAASKESSSSATDNSIGVIFVCLGNICRSPAAEAMFKQVVEERGLSDRFDIDSCGTGGGNPNWYKPGGWSYHEGEPSDPRMKQAASERGINILSFSRPLKEDDFGRFDYVVGMDEQNLGAIRLAASTWKIQEDKAEDERSYKVRLMSDYCSKYDVPKVPDPYYGGPQGFENALDLLEDACIGLLSEIIEERSL